MPATLDIDTFSLTKFLVKPPSVRLDGRVWDLLITNRSLLEFEHLTGVNTLDRKFNVLEISAADLRTLLYVLFIKQDSSVTEDRVGNWLTHRNLGPTKKAVVEAWITSMPEPETEKKKRTTVSGGTDGKKKTPPKPKTWIYLWSLATSPYGLGLSEAAWLEMTPRQIQYLERCRMEWIQHDEMIGAITASTVASFSYSPPKKPLPPEKFMVHPYAEDDKGQESSEAVSGDEIMTMLGQYKDAIANNKLIPIRKEGQ